MNGLRRRRHPRESLGIAGLGVSSMRRRTGPDNDILVDVVVWVWASRERKGVRSRDSARLLTPFPDFMRDPYPTPSAIGVARPTRGVPQTPRIRTGGLVFHLPRVKSGKST